MSVRLSVIVRCNLCSREHNEQKGCGEGKRKEGRKVRHEKIQGEREREREGERKEVDMRS